MRLCYHYIPLKNNKARYIINLKNDVVKAAVLEDVEGVEDVVLDDSVSDELLDIAKKILSTH